MLRLRLIGIISILLVLNGLFIGGASAQAATCSTHELLSIARAGSACANLEAGMSCYASGSVTSTSFPNTTETGLTQLGDRTALANLASIQVTSGSDGDAPLSIASLVISLSPDASDKVTALLVQDATLNNDVTPPVELPLQATGTLHVRSASANDASVIANLNVNNGLTATGRTSDNQWLRVTIPATGETGWVAVNLVRVTGNIDRLLVVDATQAQAKPPFSQIRFASGAGSACSGTIHAGMILQTPSTDFAHAISFSINGITLKLAGTAFVTGNSVMGSLAITMLDGAGELIVGTQTQIVPAGAQSGRTSSSDSLAKATPYDATVIDGLAPIFNTLPRVFQVTPSQTQAVIDAQIAALIQPQPTPFPTATISANECRLTVGRTSSTWSGPGQDYEIVATLNAGTAVHPVEASSDTLGATWWELEDSQWLPKSIVVERGDCSALIVPIVGKINAPPTNDYSLERCQSANGPVRVGQQVTFQFVPPPWDNLGAAQAALQTDPGHFMINAQRYWAYASQPIRLGENTNPLEDRYLRHFSMVWTAQPGTYRVTGDWLSYTPSCNLTVPVEQ